AADALLITWVGDPTATGYRIDRLLTEGSEQRVVDSASVGAERTAHRFEGLEAGTDHCFQLVAINDAGPSDPTPAACGRTLAAAPSAAPSAGAGAGQSEGAGGGGGPSEGAGGGGGGGGGQSEGAGGGGGGATEPGGGGGSEGAGGGGGAVEPQGAYVIYGSFPLNDQVQQNAAQQLVADLQAIGTPAQLVDSRQSDTFSDGLNDVGLLVVFQDGFASFEEARVECDQRRQLAPTCNAFPPRV
ncbi:MAG TPA: fibronectin type III domain-containing protein, partial [Euzebyales bacterium]|nr:fibronectin type III domain-containing protein [Euzebyales bacterium]